MGRHEPADPVPCLQSKNGPQAPPHPDEMEEEAEVEIDDDDIDFVQQNLGSVGFLKGLDKQDLSKKCGPPPLGTLEPHCGACRRPGGPRRATRARRGDSAPLGLACGQAMVPLAGGSRAGRGDGR